MMRLKGVLLACMAALPAQAADNWNVEGANGVLNVYGSLTESACSLEMASANQDVWLGEAGTSRFQSPGQRGAPVAFELRLKDCLRTPASNRDDWTGVLARSGGQPAVSVSFMASVDKDEPGLLSVTGVSGLGLQIADEQGQPVRMNERSKPVLLTPGQNTLKYTVTPVRTPATLTSGIYRAVVDFHLFYD